MQQVLGDGTASWWWAGGCSGQSPGLGGGLVHMKPAGLHGWLLRNLFL